jgi:LacI family transcriptional regulator
MPTERMGELAADLLIALVEGRTPDTIAPLPPDGMVIRSSTGPAPI